MRLMAMLFWYCYWTRSNIHTLILNIYQPPFWMLQLETADGEHFNLPYTMDFFSPKVHGRGVNISRLSPNGWALHQTSVNILSMMAVLGRVHHGKVYIQRFPLCCSFLHHTLSTTVAFIQFSKLSIFRDSIPLLFRTLLKNTHHA